MNREKTMEVTPSFFCFMRGFLKSLWSAMSKSSHSISDLNDPANVDFQVPRTTDLLLKIKSPRRRIHWKLIIPGIFCVSVGSLWMALSGEMGGPPVWWFGATMILFISTDWEDKRERQTLMVELLDELVAQNNELRHQLKQIELAKV